MADKKITDLQLRSNVNDDVNFPVDDGVQTYRATAPQVRDYVYANVQKPSDILNFSLAASVASSALTLALKDSAGNTPGSTSTVKIAFRSATLASGIPVIRSVIAALTTVISSGSTAGHSNGVAGELHLYAIDNAGAVELAWSGSRIWDERRLYSTTAEGGAGAADSDNVLYSTTARTSVAIRYLGRMISTQTTAGTWAAVPTQISTGSFDPIEPSIFIGFMDPASQWVTTSTTPVDGTNTGGNTLTKTFGQGIDVTAAASSAAGITFTPKAIGELYEITAKTVTVGGSFGEIQQLTLTDGANVLDQWGPQQGTDFSKCSQSTLTGLYKSTGTSAVTIKLQISAPAGGTSTMFDPSSISRSVGWYLKQIK